MKTILKIWILPALLLGLAPATFAATVAYDTGTATYTIQHDSLSPSEGTTTEVVTTLGGGWANNLSPAEWIAPAADQGDQSEGDSGYVEYQTTLSVPTTATGANLDIDFLADDWAIIYLDNTTTDVTTTIYGGPTGCSTPGDSCTSNPESWEGPAISVGPVSLIAGDSYSLDFDVSNTGGGDDAGGGPTGLDAQVDVNYSVTSVTPEPSSLLLLGTGLLGLAFVAFRRAKASALTF